MPIGTAIFTRAIVGAASGDDDAHLGVALSRHGVSFMRGIVKIEMKTPAFVIGVKRFAACTPS